MSLSERDQSVLDSIEDRLAGSSPELVSLLDTFTRLAADEGLPAREKIRDGRRATDRRPGLGRRRDRPGGSRRAASPRRERLRWQLIPALIWLVLSLAMIAVALTLNSEGRGASSPCLEMARTCTAETHVASP